MYGFNLGQIEGLDSSVQTVTVTIANATESNTYTLNKANEDPLVWSDGADFQSTTVYIRLTDGVADLCVVAFDEPDVGDTYNVTISTSAVEENFKSAVETVLISEPESGLPAVTEADEGKQLTVVNGEWSKNGYITEAIEKRDTSVSPNINYTVQFHRQGKLVRVHSNIIPISLFTDIVIPQGYRPADDYDGTRQLILNVGDNSVEWVQFDTGTNKFSYSGSSTGKFLIDFTYFTYYAFPTE